jgi:putative flippase GtrA
VSETHLRRLGVISVVRYALVGVVNSLVGISAIFAVKFFTSAGNVQANLIGYGVGFTCSYLLNSRWTFAYKGPATSGIFKFAAVIFFAYLCNLATVLVAINLFGLDSYLAQALGVLPYTIVGYLGGRFFAFYQSSSKQS